MQDVVEGVVVEVEEQCIVKIALQENLMDLSAEEDAEYFLQEFDHSHP
jgi:hypothetical protein